MSGKIKCDFNDCRKKEFMMAKCRCENHYCFKHKLSTIHNCSYDYITDNIKNLEVKLPNISFSKINKI